MSPRSIPYKLSYYTVLNNSQFLLKLPVQRGGEGWGSPPHARPRPTCCLQHPQLRAFLSLFLRGPWRRHDIPVTSADLPLSTTIRYYTCSQTLLYAHSVLHNYSRIRLTLRVSRQQRLDYALGTKYEELNCSVGNSTFWFSSVGKHPSTGGGIPYSLLILLLYTQIFKL